jgi:putative membrane protein
VYWSDAQWWAWIPMSIVMLGLWGLIAWAVVRLVTGYLGEGRRKSPDPIAVLDARLARGEIDLPEYHERRAALVSCARS